MQRTIRLTEEQLKEIQESTFDNGIDTPSTIPEYPQSQVNVSGKMNDEDFADPVTTDQFADKQAKSFPWGCGAYYRSTATPMVQEAEQGAISDVHNDTDQTGDGVKDIFNHADANQLIDGDETDDQQIIPHSIEMHLDRLIQAMQQQRLAPKKQMNILNKLIAAMDIKGIPPSYKKEASMKIFAKK